MTDPQTIARVLIYRESAQAAALRHQLDPWIVLGVIARESSGWPTAMCVEPKFWERYETGIRNEVSRAMGAHWLDYPHVVSASYGLMQTMVVVALERGMPLRFPTDLCDPETSLEAGCRQLAHVGAKEPTLIDGLLKYNGGGNPHYASGVLEWRDAIRTQALMASQQGGGTT